MADIQNLTKPAQRIARGYGAKLTRRVREQVKQDQLINGGLGLAASAGAALIDHQWGEGDAARIGTGRFRPQTNALVGTALIAAAAFGVGGKLAGSILSVGQGLAGPALYNFTLSQLAR